MGILSIDETKCKKDGICAQTCPAAIIRLGKGDGYPEVVRGGEQKCIACGHCVAVCPHGALSHKRVPFEACPPIRRDLVVSEAQAVQFLRSRRSIRVYRDKSVEKEQIRRLIEIARYAPSAGNAQVVEWLVFRDRNRLKSMAGLSVDWMRHVLKAHPEEASASYLPFIVAAWDSGFDAILRNAPVLLVASAPREADNGLVDLTLALSYLELGALTCGLGTCWAGLLQAALLQWQPLKEAVGLPKGHTHHYPMMLGYPKFSYQRLPERKGPKITWR